MQIMVCERCGNEVQQNTSICSACGTVQAKASNASQPNTTYGAYTEPSWYEQEFAPQSPLYGPRPGANVSQQPSYVPPQQNFGYASAYHGTAYTRSTHTINTPFAQEITFSNKNDSALIAEIILSLFGLFGIGWLMAGETAIGIILLLGSIFIYWPFVILGTIFTFGLGLICLGPFAIGIIILNTLLLNKVLNRRATKFVMMQHQHHSQRRTTPQQ